MPLPATVSRDDHASYPAFRLHRFRPSRQRNAVRIAPLEAISLAAGRVALAR